MFKKQGIDAFAARSILMKKGTAIGWKILRLVILVCFSYALIYPFIYMISSTFRGEEDLWNPTVVWVTRHFTLDNLKAAWMNMNYSESLPYSLEVAIGSAVLQSFMCAFAGYAFARFDFKFKGFLFGLVILTIIAPQQMYIIQLYGIIKNLGLVDSPAAFWVQAAFGTGIRSGLFIFIYRQTFRSLPTDLENAAAIDGCGAFGTYFRVMLPNALNSFIVVFMFSIVWHWNEYFSAELFTQHKRNAAQQLSALRAGLEAQLASSSAVAVDNPLELQVWIQAGSLLMVFPMMFVFLIGQKYLREGIARTGIVG